MTPFSYILTTLFITQLLVISLIHKKLLSCLLSLEMITLIIIIMILIFGLSTKSFITLILVLTMAACEMSIGLSLLVSLNRLWSSDSMHQLSLIKM